jgi:hypothetical protein
MQVTLGGQERTLPELRSLPESAGRRLIRVARAEGSLFAHVVIEPGPLPSGSTLGAPFPSMAMLPVEDGDGEIPPAIRERGATPVMDMLGAARTLLRARAGGKKGSSGESVWVRWMRRKSTQTRTMLVEHQPDQPLRGAYPHCHSSGTFEESIPIF